MSQTILFKFLYEDEFDQLNVMNSGYMYYNMFIIPGKARRDFTFPDYTSTAFQVGPHNKSTILWYKVHKIHTHPHTRKQTWNVICS